MDCPGNAAEVIARILSNSIMRIRAAGEEGKAAVCVVEADHIHNLSGLLVRFSFPLLRFYLEISRLNYLEQTLFQPTEQLQSDWLQLESILNANQMAENSKT